MPSYTDQAAFTHAIAVVTAGLQSGSIKLIGPSSDDFNGGIKADSDYLNAIINAFAKNLQTPTPGR